MAKRTFDVDVNVNSRKADSDLKKFNKTLDKTNKELKTTKGATDKAKGGFSGFVKGLSGGTKALGGVAIAVTAVVAAYTQLNDAVKTSALAVRELDNLARTAGVTIQQFQGMSLAAEKFGFDQGKVADVIKDFNDKLGDLTVNGSGPFKDMLKRLGDESGLTAESLSRMSGQEGIGAVIDAMKRMNIPAKEQTNILESLAGDLSTVIPLFENAGAAINGANAELVNTNSILTNLEITKLKDFAESTSLLDAQWSAFGNKVSANIAPALQGLNGIISEFLTLMNAPTSIEKEALKYKSSADKAKFYYDSIIKSEETIAKLQAQPYNRTNNERIAQIQSQLVFMKELAEQSDKDAINDKKIVDDKVKGQEAITKAFNKSFEDQIKGIGKLNAQVDTQVGKFNESAEALAAFNAELKRTAEVDKYIASLGGKFGENTAKVKELKALYREMLVDRDNLAIAVKAEATATKEADAAAKGKLKTDTASVKLTDTRLERFKDTELALKRELALLNATTDAEKAKLQLQFQATDLNLTGTEADAIKLLNEQIAARQKHLDILQEEKDAVTNLAEAMGNWASGSKDAIKTVIAELIRLVAIQAFGGTGSFLGSFLTGFGSGGMRGFAEGGQFNAGETFMVGEQGPEIITASSAGTVIPNNQLGGMGAISISPQLVINGGVNGMDDLQNILGSFSNEIAQQTNKLIKTQLSQGGVFA